MKANDISPNTAVRLKRIEVASRIFRLLLNGYVLLALINVTVFVCAIFWNFGAAQGVGFVWHVEPDRVSHFWKRVSGIPGFISALGVLKIAVLCCCVFVLNKLFRFYERGRLFAPEQVRYMQQLGCLIVANWVIAVVLNAMSPGYAEYQLDFAHLNWIGTLSLALSPITKDMIGNNDIGIIQPVFGALFVFIAWIMDEGRKIQEEQELTV